MSSVDLEYENFLQSSLNARYPFRLEEYSRTLEQSPAVRGTTLHFQVEPPSFIFDPGEDAANVRYLQVLSSDPTMETLRVPSSCQSRLVLPRLICLVDRSLLLLLLLLHPGV